jgi:predicted GNAT family acetyltransferase
MAIHHNAANQEFTSGPADQQAELAYSLPAAGVIDFVHTFVPENQRGQGLADELAQAGLAYARQQHLKVRTSCRFMAGYVQQHHQQYADILDS